MSELLDAMAEPSRPAEVLPTPDDKLLALLEEDTAVKVIRDEPIEPVDTPDFDPLDPEPEPAPEPGNPFGSFGADGDIEKAMISLADLPVETIVDTVDVTLTDVIVRANGLEDYEGKDEDKLFTTDADKKALVKDTKRYLDSQEIKVTPLTGLLITAVIVYGKKFMFASKLKKLARRNAELESQIDETDRENEKLKQIVKDRETEIIRLRMEKEKEKERKPKDETAQGDIDTGKEGKR